MRRMAERGRGETCGVGLEREVERELVVGLWRAVEGEWEVGEISRGS